MSDRAPTLAKVLELIEPFNKKGVEVTEATRFAQDLEWDSLTVLDFVANIEDAFGVTLHEYQDLDGKFIAAVEDLQLSPEIASSTRFRS